MIPHTTIGLHPHPQPDRLLGATAAGRPQPKPSQEGWSTQESLPSPQFLSEAIARPSPGCTTTAHFPHPLWGPHRPPASSQRLAGWSPYCPLPRAHTSQMPWQFSDGREVGHSWCRVVGYEVRGSGGPRSALGSCSREAHQEGRQGHAVQGREWEETGHGEGLQGRCQLLGAIFRVALAVGLAILLGLQVIRA